MDALYNVKQRKAISLAFCPNSWPQNPWAQQIGCCFTSLGLEWFNAAIANYNTTMGHHRGSFLSLVSSSHALYCHSSHFALNITSLDRPPLTANVKCPLSLSYRSLFLCLRVSLNIYNYLLLFIYSVSAASIVLFAFLEQETLFLCSPCIGCTLCAHNKRLWNICWINKWLWVQYCCVLVRKKITESKLIVFRKSLVKFKQYAFIVYLLLPALI